MERNEKGQFVGEGKHTRYKNVQHKGVGMANSRKVWIKRFGDIPDGFVVHHINGNKRDDRIENLKCMSYAEHNKIHSHKPWNSGINKDNKKIRDWHAKTVKTRNNNTNMRNSITHKLRYFFGMSVKEISQVLGICGRQIYSRINQYTEEQDDKVQC